MIIGVIAFKGGVTKTTTASNLADVFAREHGKRVLLVDCDLQCQSTVSMGYEPGSASETTLSELLISLRSAAPIPPARAYLRTRLENLTLLPGDFQVKNAFTRADPDFDEPTKDWFCRLVAPVRDDFDVIVFDAPHDRGAVSRAIIEVADLVLIPTPQEPFAVQGAADTIKVLQRIAGDAKAFRILATKIDKREPAVLQDFNADIQPLVDKGWVIDVVRYSSDVKHSQGYRKTVFEYNPQSAAAQDYRRVSHKILNLHSHGTTQQGGAPGAADSDTREPEEDSGHRGSGSGRGDAPDTTDAGQDEHAARSAEVTA